MIEEVRTKAEQYKEMYQHYVQLCQRGTELQCNISQIKNMAVLEELSDKHLEP